ncbi:MAG TPA: hypothetical protein VMF60_09530 [Acidimicrobiales bacterium]|nr:hypothetical protein [Acidimicrobiales bacterium]
MPEAPDPLGKRALFWAPAERHDAGPRGPENRVPPGRHALFSTSAVTPTGAPKRNGRARRPAPKPAAPKGAATTATPKARAAGSRRPPAGPRRPSSAPKRVSRPSEVGPASGPITLTCSRCDAHSDVDVLRYLVLHFPVWFWRPGRGYTSLMRCPACGKRTWLSATWSAKTS